MNVFPPFTTLINPVFAGTVRGMTMADAVVLVDVVVPAFTSLYSAEDNDVSSLVVVLKLTEFFVAQI